MAELIPLHPRPEPTPALDPLWRHLLGGRIRRLRHDRGETLTATAARAGVSPQYLSEVERGRKEASSEMVAAILGALESSLLDLTVAIGDELGRREDERMRRDLATQRELGAATPFGGAAPASTQVSVADAGARTALALAS